jgi:hypothetical protein
MTIHDQFKALDHVDQERFITWAILESGFSITRIVELKEEAMHTKFKRTNNLLSGLAMRVAYTYEKIDKQVRSLIANDLIASGVVRGTPFEDKLKEDAKETEDNYKKQNSL